MVYETIIKGLSKYSLDNFKAVMFTSDGNRDIYNDFDKILGLLSDSEYFYVVVFRNGKRHIHMLVRDCPFFKYQLKEIWTWLHGCPKFNLEPVRNVNSIALYFATQDSIEYVGMSGGWL